MRTYYLYEMSIPHIFLILSLCLLSAQTSHAALRALVVGIGEYDEQATGWHAIHGDNDVTLLSPILERQGFNVVTLVNEHATKAAIVDALNELIGQCGTGDDVYIHFSCHGQRVEDLNGDEASGLDGSVIPYDACRSSYYLDGTYQGENHLVDDELSVYLSALRSKIGDTGHLFLAVDACYSRGIERGDDDDDIDDDCHELSPSTIRGTSDVFSANAKGYLATIATPPSLTTGAHLAVVTACKEDERNYEYIDNTTGNVYGSLSFCMAKLIDEGVDFARWEAYFSQKAYKSSHVFANVQHPTVTAYR